MASGCIMEESDNISNNYFLDILDILRQYAYVMEIIENPEKVDIEPRIQVNVELKDDDAELFGRYMQSENLRTKSAAGYKLMMERLREWQQAEAIPA